MIDENEEAICNALNEDLHRHVVETMFLELSPVKKAILEFIKNLESWAMDQSPNIGFPLKLVMKARIRYEPLGVALIISAWNFPIDSLIEPLLGAISAGCCVMMKPSELAPATQKCLAQLIPKYLDLDAIRLVTGGPQETSRILERRFDHIFFTGSSKIGKFITAAAAKHLTPTVLELGGQGPVILTASADVDLAAKRIANLKIVNSGQMCLSANHVFVDPSIHDLFLERLQHWLQIFLVGSEEGCSRIVDERNYKRLAGLLDRSQGTISYAGEKNPDKKILGPTVVTNITTKDSLLQDELFGPILPVIKADYVTAYKTIQKTEYPLVMYIFGTNKDQINEILHATNSGGVTINDVILHAVLPNLPFGGVGHSGHGAYHGKYSFRAFSHERPILESPGWIDRFMGFRYLPYRMEILDDIRVKNELGFRKGEGIEDQRIKGSWVIRLQSWFGV